MKILRIHITNIASLTDVEIDFEHGPLASDPIFLITGPTGAGKSTILNSICLALYNQCPSLADKNRVDRDFDNLPLSNPQIMIRKGVKQAEVRLTFIGNDARRYEALWQQTRVNTRKKKDGREAEVKYRALRTLTDVASGVEEELTNDRTVALTGLTYEQFTRTTLLAQGQFARFLTASGEDKARILEKITGTDIYSEIGVRIAAEHRDITNTLSVKKEALGSLRILSDDELEMRQERFCALDSLIRASEEKVARMQTQIDWINHHDRLWALLSSLRQGETRLMEESDSPEFRRGVDLVSQFDATAPARELIIREESLQRHLDSCTGDLLNFQRLTLPGLFGMFDSLSLEIAKITERVSILSAKINDEKLLQEAFAKAEIAVHLAARVKEAMDDIAAKEAKVSSLAAQADSLTESVNNAAERLEQAQKELDSARGRVEEFREVKAKIDPEALNAALIAPKDKLQHIHRAEQASRTLDGAREETTRLSEECDTLSRQISQLETAITTLEQKRPQLESEYTVHSKLCEALSSLNDKISEICEGLEATETCPLCGSRHVHFVGRDAVSSQVQDAREARDRAKKALEECDAGINKREAVLRANMEVLHSRLALLDEKKKALAELKSDYDKDFHDVDLSDAEALLQTKTLLQSHIDKAQQALNEAWEIIRQADEAQTHFQKCETAVSKAREAHQHAAEELRKNISERTVMQTEINVLRTAVTEALEQANSILPRDFVATAENLESKAKAFQRRADEYADAKKEFADLTAALSRLQDMHRTASVQLSPFASERDALTATSTKWEDNFIDLLSDFLSSRSAKKALIDEAQKALNDCRENIKHCLEENPDISRELLLSLIESTEAVTAFRQRITAHNDELIKARAGVTTVQSQLTDHLRLKPELPEDSSAETLRQALEAEKSQANLLKEEFVRLRTELSGDAALRAESQVRINEIKELETQCALWKRLNDLLGTNNPRFRNVAQSYVLRTLLTKANCYLHTFSGRYTLAVRPGSLTISVIDNEWPASARAANSLSGGESFIVSLALALALASISKEKINVDTLFIDEGFGSLDPESQSMIIDALDTLHRIGGRRIGIISHVDVLKERIPTQIRLRKLGGNASSLSIIRTDG